MFTIDHENGISAINPTEGTVTAGAIYYQRYFEVLEHDLGSYEVFFRNSSKALESLLFSWDGTYLGNRNFVSKILILAITQANLMFSQTTGVQN